MLQHHFFRVEYSMLILPYYFLKLTLYYGLKFEKKKVLNFFLLRTLCYLDVPDKIYAQNLGHNVLLKFFMLLSLIIIYVFPRSPKITITEKLAFK